MILALFSPGLALAQAVGTSTAPVRPGPPGGELSLPRTLLKPWQGFPWRMTGSMSLNWRGVGPKRPEFETQIQHQLFLADLYFAFLGPALDGVPFRMELNMPTGAQGQASLYQMYFQYKRFEDWDFHFGKFLVPYGRYNELYRPDMFLTVTRPLLYASPDSLDLVVRHSSPRPPFSSGYTDVGARASYYPPWNSPVAPSEVTLFVVNGLGEASNRSRTFPRPDNLGIPPPPANGKVIDFGHENNNLADNNNDKAAGGRLVYAVGSLDLPWPIPEGKRDLSGLSLGFSMMSGLYDLEAENRYHLVGVDMAFEYEGYNISAEYTYSFQNLHSPFALVGSSTTVQPTVLVKDFESLQGYFVQASFPLLRRPRRGKRLTAVFVFNQLFRRGPLLTLYNNQLINGTLFPSVAAYVDTSPRLSTRMDKFTFGLNYQLTDHFALKGEYSYWFMGRAAPTIGAIDIYQGAFSIVSSF
ncbi:MAG: hypothetical protein HY553_11095 [Elusimicrobia bacterium]|nr:hypothetical protein [Elusimicrobiota bacterium]